MTIRVYYLETEKVDGAERPKGIEYIHGGILDIEGTLRKLIQDTTDAEHNGLIAVAESWRKANTKEKAQLAELPPPSPPARNLAQEFDEIKASLTTLAKKVDTIVTRGVIGVG